MDDWLIYLIFFGGGVFHSALGFGFPLFTTPLISIFYDVRYAILITVIPTTFNNLFNIVSGGPFIGLVKRFSLLAFFGMVGSFVGTYLIIYFPGEPFKLLLSLSIGVYLYTRYRSINLPFIKEDWPNMIVFGILGGIIGGTVNVSLAIFVIFFLNLGLSKTETIKMINFCFVWVKITQIITYALNDFYNYPVLEKIFIATLAVIPGMAVGYQVRRRIAEEAFRKFLYITLVISGAIVGYQGIHFFF